MTLAPSIRHARSRERESGALLSGFRRGAGRDMAPICYTVPINRNAMIHNGEVNDGRTSLWMQSRRH